MNKEVKTLWIEALRSGKYRQTERVLADNYGHCCLGVLCEIAVQQNVIRPPTLDFSSCCWRYDAQALTGLPLSVQDWAGLDLPDGGLVTINGRTDSLASHNDQGVPFNAIADAIEEQL